MPWHMKEVLKVLNDTTGNILVYPEMISTVLSLFYQMDFQFFLHTGYLESNGEQFWWD
jgi:hypothetical protein